MDLFASDRMDNEQDSSLQNRRAGSVVTRKVLHYPIVVVVPATENGKRFGQKEIEEHESNMYAPGD